jgi:hypothetical protein
MCKSRLFLVLAIVAGMLSGLSMMISKNYVWAARLLIFPSLVGCLICLAMYAKSTRQG